MDSSRSQGKASFAFFAAGRKKDDDRDDDKKHHDFALTEQHAKHRYCLSLFAQPCAAGFISQTFRSGKTFTVISGQKQANISPAVGI